MKSKMVVWCYIKLYCDCSLLMMILLYLYIVKPICINSLKGKVRYWVFEFLNFIWNYWRRPHIFGLFDFQCVVISVKFRYSVIVSFVNWDPPKSDSIHSWFIIYLRCYDVKIQLDLALERRGSDVVRLKVKKTLQYWLQILFIKSIYIHRSLLIFYYIWKYLPWCYTQLRAMSYYPYIFFQDVGSIFLALPISFQKYLSSVSFIGVLWLKSYFT